MKKLIITIVILFVLGVLFFIPLFKGPVVQCLVPPCNEESLTLLQYLRWKGF